MSWEYIKSTDEYVFSGMEKGVAPSPHSGPGNMQGVNISTETGEAMVSYVRVQQTMTDTAATGSLAFVDGSHVSLDIPGSNDKFKGQWISVSATSHSGELANGTYYVLNTSGSNFVLSATYEGSGITGYTAGLTATIALVRRMGKPVAWAQETYFVSGSAPFYRYYVLDAAGLVWVYDTANDVFPSDDEQYWVLPDTSVSYFGSDTAPSGLCVLNGWLMVLSGNSIWVKPTVKLGSGYTEMTNVVLMSRANTTNPHAALVGHQGRAYYTDGNYVGSIFPDTSLVTGVANVQSYASYTTSTTTGTIANLYGGSIPSTGANISTAGFSRIPAVFFASAGGAAPTALTANNVFYIEYSTANQTFQVFAAISGGSALDITTGASGTQYYNTFYPLGTHAGAFGDHSTMVFTPQRLNLPTFEVATALAEIGNTVIVGATGNVLYPWNQIDATPSSIISLPEAGTAQLLTVNQMAYVFAGRKGNIYITDGSVASLVIKLPDYCAGIAGTIGSYYEPTFTWGGVMYLRGRVYFSALDQTLQSQSSSELKAGNCGGVWSFVPTQNLYIGQDTGLALRLENRSSYGTYSGVATVLIPKLGQGGISPQYWSGWYSSLVSASSVNGIDNTGTVGGTGLVETDFLPTGTMLDKKTFSQIEYKVSAPLAGGDTVQLWYRVNATDAWATCGTVKTETDQSLSGFFNVNFQKTQWVQLQAVLTSNGSPSSSLCRLSQIILR